ncbi:ArsR family transcriptional regulator [Curtobacterium sp. MCSS17_008]|uniref:arylsulfotransferase family protein n=1 Tax=Curtobacterium sp. MCSS17_008 TaxID=2175647 RepID=UPI000DA8713C|nr:arylsulfotransferase family protein [Curtobacterium sp. MCSS17_008]PZF57052.1 ArsR family transcriptional regulator [Curtobacterium sp. MCSS17_008]
MGDTTQRHALGRRDLLVGAGGLAAGGAAGWFGRPLAHTRVASPTPSAEAEPAADAAAVRRWATIQPTLAGTTVTRGTGTPAPGLLFSALDTDVHRGVITDDEGEPVWVDTSGADMYDLRVQEYRGEPVLTYVSGLLTDGYGIATGTILDRSYRVLETVHAGNGLSVDLHEFLITAQDTALVTAYPVVPGDLSSVGGPTDGWFIDCHVQEIDIASGALLLDWRASDHLALAESKQAIGDDGRSAASPWDPFHLNSCTVDGDDGLLLSARHTHAVYAIDRSSGAVRWRLGGERSDFEVADDAVFAWQHHAVRSSPTRMTLFDNVSKDGSSPSRGLVLRLDEQAMTATLDHEYRHAGRKGIAMGSMQHLDGGHLLVGWGTGKGLTEFAADGTVVLDIAFDGASYRSFRHEWTGTPARPPAVVARTTAGTPRAYASWNGSTETVSWRFDHGTAQDALTSSVTADRTGFETHVALPTSARWVRAVAIGSDGTELARSAVVRV